jgi:kynurenine formamidase
VAAGEERHTFLSYPITADSPNPPAIPAVEIAPLYRVAEGDAANVSVLKVANHTGTHADAPAHVIEGGIKISEFEPQELLFNRPVVIDFHLGDGEVVLPSHLERFLDLAKNADLLLCRFGYGPVRRNEPARYSSKCPGFGIASAESLRKNLPSLRAIGMDVPSLACIEHLDETMAAHNVLLRGVGRRFLVIEDMNLEGDLCGLSSVWVAPWLIAEIDSAPCTVVARFC